MNSVILCLCCFYLIGSVIDAQTLYTLDGQAPPLVFTRNVSVESRQTISGNVYALVFMNLTGESSRNQGIYQILLSSINGADVWVESPTSIPDVGTDSSFNLNATQRANGARYPSFAVSKLLDLTYPLVNRTTLRNAIVITTSKPINIFASRSTQGTSEGYLALPLMQESTSFWLTSYKTSHLGVSSFAIASVLDGACVEGYRVNGTQYDRVFVQTLNKNDVYIESERDEDYSGIFINSTRPIAVFSGHECAQVPVHTKFCDHLIEQVPPANHLGTKFVVPPIYGRSKIAGYELRVVAIEMDTEINIHATNERVFLNRGLYYHSTQQDDATIPTVVTCSKPCLVSQYNKGKKADPLDPSFTDPFMMIIPPVSHWDRDITFTTSKYEMWEEQRDFENWCVIVCRTQDRYGMSFDGASITGSWVNMGEGYSVVTFSIQPGVHGVINSDPNALFTGFVYGHSQVEPTAYGYPIAYKMFGTPLKGTWYDKLFNDDKVGPSQTLSPTLAPTANPNTPSPNRRCTLGTLYTKYIGVKVGTYQRFVLVGVVPQGGVTCASSYYAAIRANKVTLRNVINEWICLTQTCSYTNHTFVHDIKVEYQPGAPTLTLYVTMATGVEDIIRNAAGCKLEVRDLVENYARNWRSIIPNPSGCADVVFSRPVNSSASNSRVCPLT